MHILIKFNQRAWLKQYIDINTYLRKKVRNNFKKDLFKLMGTLVFDKTMENEGKPRDIKFVTTEKRKNYLVSESNNYTTKTFSEYLLAIEMKKEHRYWWIN